jgi:GH43 family beta-xylosidase
LAFSLIDAAQFPDVAAAAAPAATPVIDHDAPDPSLLRVDNTYYAFTTNVNVMGTTLNIPVYSSTDLTTWTALGDALPSLGPWASRGFTWAPSVARIGTNWVLYYTALFGASGVECIGVATASKPEGPYTDAHPDPLACQFDHGGSIDPAPYVDSTGAWWLTWKSDDNAIGGIPGLWSQRLGADGQSLSGNPNLLLLPDQWWEESVVEAPMLLNGAGKLWLFYSAAPFDSAAYAVGYAICSSPAGPCTKQTRTTAWLSSASTPMVGPGGESFVTTPDGRTDMALHGWRGAVGYNAGGYRAMYVTPIDFDSGVPRLRSDLGRIDGLSAVPAPVLASRGDGTSDLVTRDAAGVTWHRTFDERWQSWASLGGLTTASPAAVWRSSVLDVFVRGTDGGLWHQPFTTAGPTAWESLGGLIVGAPAATSPSATRVDVFARGTDGALWHRAFISGTWTAWESLGGLLVGSPAVASNGPGQLDVFAPGTDGALWHRALQGTTWSPWESLGGIVVGAPAAASNRAGQLDAFVRGQDSSLWHRALVAGRWTAWENLGGQLRSDPTADSPVAGGVQVAVGGSDGDAWYRLADGSPWTPWQPLGAGS